jgi:hypothetical protein
VVVVGSKFRFSRPTGVAPHELIGNLFVFGLGFQVDFEGTFNFIQLLYGFERVSDAAMHAEDVVLDECSQGHLLEDPVDSVKEGVLILDVLLEFYCALIAKSHVFIDLSVLVASA